MWGREGLEILLAKDTGKVQGDVSQLQATTRVAPAMDGRLEPLRRPSVERVS